MTLKELANSLRAESAEHAQALEYIAQMIEAMILANDHWMGFPFDARPVKVTGEFGVMYTIGGMTWEHEGIDFSLPIGVPILACASAKVIFAGIKDGYGNCVRLEHLRNGEKWWTWYGHLNTIRVQTNQIVVAGEVIGASGNTGNTTGAHLHLTVQREDSDFQPKGCTATLKGVVNPRDWLQWPEG